MSKLLRALAYIKTTSKVLLVPVVLALVLLASVPSTTNAQTPPLSPPPSPPPTRDVPKTNIIGDLFKGNDQLGKIYYASCREDGAAESNYYGLPCIIEKDEVITSCVFKRTAVTVIGGLAATCTYTSTVDGSQYIADPEFWAGASDTNYYSTGERVDRTAGGTEDPGTLNDAANPPGDCSYLNMGQCFLNLPGILFSALGYLLLTLSGMILGIAGVVFNWVVIRTVFQFALYFGTSEGMIVAWGVLRDIANIALLFGFIFMGIATILNTKSVEGYTAKKALPSLIIFAVLLNFSLFATQGIIDVANGFSSVFASYAGESCETTTSGEGVNGQSNARCANLGISSKILQAVGMNQIIPSGDQAMSALSNTLDQPYTMAVMYIVLSIMVTITAMVLFAASIMLVIRVVVLSLLMVTSPIGFAGMAIPALHKIAKDWWHKLINQAFFAPIYLLMVFVSLKLVDTLQDGQATVYDAMIGNTASGATTAGNMQVVVVFMIVIGFMIAALVIAQKMGAYGANFATKSAAGLTLGVHGFVARRTAGRLAGGLASKVAGSTWAQNNPGAGRLVHGALNKGATASFSVRKGVAGLDFGTPNKAAAGGYAGIKKKAVDERTEFAKKLTTTKEDREKIAASAGEVQETQAQIRAENTHQEAVQENYKRDEEAQKAADAPAINTARADLKLKADEVKAARATGTDEEKKLAEEQYNNDLRAFDNMQKEAEERLSVIRSAAAAEKRKHDELVGSLNEYVNAQSDNIKFTEKQPQRRYANALGKGGLPAPFVDGVANKESSKAILKDIDKDANQKMKDALDAFNKKTDNK